MKDLRKRIAEAFRSLRPRLKASREASFMAAVVDVEPPEVLLVISDTGHTRRESGADGRETEPRWRRSAAT